MRGDKEVSLEPAEKAERFVDWGCKASLIDLQLEIFLKIHALRREREQERLSLQEGSSFQPLRQGRSSTEQLKKSRERKTGMHLHPLKSIKNWRVN